MTTKTEASIMPDESSQVERTSSGSSTQLSIATERDDTPRSQPPAQLLRTTTTASVGPPFSIFTPNQKRFIVFMAAWAGFFSPVSANIYFPALNQLALDLHVSNSLINLTLTSYMIFQGLAPALFGNLADTLGRRPVYMICFVIYVAANIGLALQNSYAALFVLRCIQSTGSSATVAMASAVVSDIATPAERGKYMGLVTAGALVGPALGPVVGGLLAQFLGWRAIFWFLTIFATVFLIVLVVFYPETARNTVGNGSIAPRGLLHMSLMSYLARRRAAKESPEELQDEKDIPGKTKVGFPNPLASLKIIWDKQNACLLFYNAFLFAGFYDVAATIPSQFARIYGFNVLQIGLCYLPFGIGSMCAALCNGQLLDRNFARFARKLGVKIKRGRDQNLREFPIEKARLQIAIPAAYSASVMIIIFGWLIDFEAPLAAILVILFLASFSMSLAFNVTSTLLVDFYPLRAGMATAANNLVRCLLGAGATAVIVPMINGMTAGWAFTFIGLFVIASSPMVWLNYFYGMKWREERRVRDERTITQRQSVKSEKLEEARTPESVADDVPVQGGLQELAAVAEKEQAPHT